MNAKTILPPVWFLLAIFVMIGLHRLWPFAPVISPPFTYFGIGVMVVGLLFNLSGAYLFRQNNTTIKPFEESSQLITAGLYNYSRNPIYLGMVVILIGLGILLGTLPPLIVILAFLGLIQEKFIKIEEQMLTEKFGQQYLTYQERVRRWI
ncbi:MAG: isoprenylcysteine carboxylmethyltransferase family protein [Hormoscilla sp.]